MKAIVERIRSQRSGTEVVGLMLIVTAVVALLSLASYSADDPSWFTHRPPGTPVHNLLGRVGTLIAETLLQLLGTAAFVGPLALAVLGVRLLRTSSERMGFARWSGYVALAVFLCALLDLLYGTIGYGGDSFRAGGYVGYRISGALRALLNPTGAILLSLTALVLITILLTRLSFVRSAQLIGGWTVAGGRRLSESARESLRSRRDRRAKLAVANPIEPQRPSIRLEENGAEPPSAPLPPSPSRPRVVEGRAAKKAGPKKRKIETRQTSLPIDQGRRGYALPPVDLLNEPEPQAIESERELLERARLITDKLQEFTVGGSVVAIHPGPVVTTFEFKPEAGVKYSKITGMTDDLSLALRAESVRIDRMPGRATVGIEVPNRRQETIFPRDMFSSERFRSAPSKLTMALGKDISGDVFTTNLERMPHLLIAGATGSGKSVGLNGMIASILYKATPDQVRFIMIDTKMIELGVYAGIPHLLVPVVTDPKHASTALKWACREMEQRYRKLASVGVRNLEQFNSFLADNPGRVMEDPRGGDDIPLENLPFIVIVIDELADLMMVSASDVEGSIMRLAQMARAVGIHLIIATQRPSVDVITGTIKANFPSRIAFRVAQRVDSRTIIDQQGAEHLLGRGDMLLLSSGSSRLQRLHGGLITEVELNRITSYVKKHAAPEYDESVLRDSEGESGEGGACNDERDEMYAKAVRTVIQDGKCSITLIQRRLQLGYARAARIVDMMEREGLVGPGEGSKPREILVGPEILETLDAPAPI